MISKTKEFKENSKKSIENELNTDSELLSSVQSTLDDQHIEQLDWNRDCLNQINAFENYVVEFVEEDIKCDNPTGKTKIFLNKNPTVANF